MKVAVTCPCGASFATTSGRLEEGRGRYCQKACMYRFRTRPTGLKYQKHKENPTSFKPGRAGLSGEHHPNWKGGEVGYRQLHDWVRANLGRPSACLVCGATTDDRLIEWANVSHEYLRDLSDWAPLCRFCHRDHDSGPARGAATRKYGSAVREGR